MHLTALNAKSEPEAELAGEFNRVFSKESPDALKWAFEAWRDKSPFFPAISDVLKLVKEYKRGQREHAELKARLDEKFLIEQRRALGQVPDFPDVVKQLQAIAVNIEPEWMKREKKFRDRMQHAAAAIPTLTLSDEQIRARRFKEREEIQRHEDAL